MDQKHDSKQGKVTVEHLGMESRGGRDRVCESTCGENESLDRPKHKVAG